MCGSMPAVSYLDGQDGSLLTKQWALQVPQHETHLTGVNINISCRGNRKGNGRVWRISEHGELEGDMLFELNTDCIGLLEKCCGAQKCILVGGRRMMWSSGVGRWGGGTYVACIYKAAVQISMQVAWYRMCICTLRDT